VAQRRRGSRDRTAAVILAIVAIVTFAGCAGETAARTDEALTFGQREGGAPFVTGVNLGADGAGALPGRVALSRHDVRRWLLRLHGLDAPGGDWRLQHLLVNRELTHPLMGDAVVAELRLPFTGLGSSDPSSKTAS
jgi:hypothetical protein